MNLPWEEIFRRLSPTSVVLLVVLILLWRAYNKLMERLFSAKLELLNEKMERLKDRLENLQKELLRLQIKVDEADKGKQG